MKDELDILKEVGNIAAAHGSIALSEILRKKINLEVPKTELLSRESIQQKIAFEKIGVAVYSKIVTGLNGRVIFLLDEKNAFRLNELSYQVQSDSKASGVLTEMGMSVIKEIGSMVTSAYVTAIGMMFKRVILLGAPMLISGTMNEILNITVFSGGPVEEDKILLVEARFEEPETSIRGSFYLVLTPQAAADVQQVCKKMLEELEH
ncbi:MAG: chemotaxis protein CheC [Candidatus Omnitrophica bacterium]|nr:chemotaxis protein CheC [Candidatus Omnitrophota bacterium]